MSCAFTVALNSGVYHMSSLVRASSALVLAAVLLGGCASEGGNFFTTGSLAQNTAEQQAATAAPKVDPQCVALYSRIETLRKDGIVEKIEKAAIKKIKLTAADAQKADQLNKANAEFQSRCSTITPSTPVTAQATPPAPSRPATN